MNSDKPRLYQQSINIILRHQQSNGAYPACPTMPDYQFCWFRDGSYIAHAMLRVGETASTTRFHQWATDVLLRYEAGARRAMADYRAGKKVSDDDILCARYSYDGSKGTMAWPDFQLDGLGTWLWTLRDYTKAGNGLSPDMLKAATLAAEYLTVFWASPCHDLWEEFGDRIHTYTLGAIFAGLEAASELLQQPEMKNSAEQVRAYILANCTTPESGFIKLVGMDTSDGSLTALITPYQVVKLDDEIASKTMARLETELYAKGFGVHRYLKDSYYGGGAWLLLAAWVAWYRAERGETEQAKQMLEAMEPQANANGELPEQVVPPMLAEASYYDYWVKVRGPIATPLLWSHAMYLIVSKCIEG